MDGRKVSEDIEMTSECSSEVKSFSQSKQKKTTQVSQAFIKIKKDLADYESKKMTSGHFSISLSNCYEYDDDSYHIYADFEKLFKLNITFYSDYPYSIPSITYISGYFTSELFDMEQNLKLQFVSKKGWNPVLTVNSIIYSIELMLLNHESPEVISLIQRSQLKKQNDKKKNCSDIFFKPSHKKKYYEFEKENEKYLSNYCGEFGDNFNNNLLKRMKIPNLA